MATLTSSQPRPEFSYCHGNDPAQLLHKPDEKLCHNCATKPFFTAKTDFIDSMRLLILRNLLKTKSGPKIPAYRLARPFFLEVQSRFLPTRRLFLRNAAAALDLV